MLVRRSVLSYKGFTIGKGVIIERGVILDKLNPRGVEIGDYSLLAKGVVVLSHSHVIRRQEDLPMFYTTVIESNCFIGINTIINPGVIIGSGSIIGDGSVVTKDIPSGVFAAGNPAKVIRYGLKTGKYGKLFD